MRGFSVSRRSAGIVAALAPHEVLLDLGGGLIWADCPQATDPRARQRSGAFSVTRHWLRASEATRATTAERVSARACNRLAQSPKALRDRF